jgi:hypothetical protein
MHADPKTTTRCGRARTSLDQHATHIAAAPHCSIAPPPGRGSGARPANGTLLGTETAPRTLWLDHLVGNLRAPALRSTVQTGPAA